MPADRATGCTSAGLYSLAEACIEDAVRELGTARPARPVMHVPPGGREVEEACSLPEAVAHYFRFRGRQTREAMGAGTLITG